MLIVNTVGFILNNESQLINKIHLWWGASWGGGGGGEMQVSLTSGMVK